MEKDQNFNYQFIVFGDFIDISADNVQSNIDVLKLFKDENFKPTVFKQQKISTMQPLQVSNRIRLTDEEGCEIRISIDRIDVYISYVKDKKYAEMDLKESAKKAIELISKIIKKYNKKCNRIALNTMTELNTEKSKKIEEKYLERRSLIEFYNENKLEEWRERLLARVKGNKLKEEVINTITTVSKEKRMLRKYTRNKKNRRNNCRIRHKYNTRKWTIKIFGKRN